MRVRQRLERPEGWRSGASEEGAPDSFFLSTALMCSKVPVVPGIPKDMFESLNDHVDVLTSFTEGKLEPLRFRWKGSVVRIRKITGRWSRREGQALLRYFSVEGPAADT